MRLVAFLLLALLLAACGDDEDASIKTDTRACAPVDIRLDGVPEVDNPFDPAQLRIDVTFTGPDGAAWTLPAFFHRSYERALVGGFEHLTATDEGGWRARFTPPRAGSWQWSAAVTVTGTAVDTKPRGAFSCEVDADSHGVLRRSAVDPRYLAWEDGTPYLAIGENLCWYDGRGTFAYDVWLDRLQEHGATWIRLWMPSWAFGLEWIRRNPDGSIAESTLGDYRGRLDRAWQLDYVIEAARRRGMVVMLAIQNHGAFSLTSNSEWADNPYNAVNGGPLARPHDLYTDAEARELFARRLRYIVGRWAYAPNLIWELWNEVDLADAAPIGDVVEWHREMGGVLHSLDPYRHLVTSSLAFQVGGPSPEWLALWRLPEIDLAQIHLYGIGTLAPADFAVLVPLQTRRLHADTGKPVLLGEAGVDFRGPAETVAADPDHLGLHELLWSGVFGGGLGSGMSWWWDNVIDPEDQYHQLDGLVRLTAGVAWDEESFDAATDNVRAEAPAAELRVLPLVGTRTALVWIRNADHAWFRPDAAPIAAAQLRLDDIESGRWRATWLEPLSGATVAEAEVSASAADASVGGLDLAVPTFAGEIALRLDRLPQ